MIGLLVWPCSDPSHRDCFGVVDTSPLLLDLLQKREIRNLVYLEDHLSYDEACSPLHTDLLYEVRDTARTGTCFYDLSVCNEPSHTACYNVIDIEASIHADSDVYVIEHVSYIEALSKLQELWQSDMLEIHRPHNV